MVYAMKKIALLGASGSIGLQTIDVIEQHPDCFVLVAMSIGKNIQVIDKILQKHTPKLLCVQREEDAFLLSEKYHDIEIVFGDEGLLRIAEYADYDVLVNALVGFAGLKPTLQAIQHKKDIALANKECLVVAGHFIQEAVKKHQVQLLPIDSEHSAIFQALQGNKKSNIRRLLITASGGSFRNLSREDLHDVTKADALKHPNWTMGDKITIDSATMMNKGFEVIEAHWLFDVDYENIEVLLHKESVIHSLIEFVDKSVLAQLGIPDMRLPIQYALSFPDRIELAVDSYDFSTKTELHLEPIDFARYPLLELAFEIGKKGGNLPAVMNAANEVAVRAFLDEKIPFLKIEEYVIAACKHFEYIEEVTLEDIFYYDNAARVWITEKLEGDGLCK